ncbi:MAG: hypothetical protein QM751_14070 [Paludibacteraceae bacterium]
MKKSKIIKLVLVSVTLASCNHSNKQEHDRKVYMRSDSTAGYSRTEGHSHFGGYYAFRPYGVYYQGGYIRSGYYSNGIHESSNIGHNSFKGTSVRGGFGRSTFHVSS